MPLIDKLTRRTGIKMKMVSGSLFALGLASLATTSMAQEGQGEQIAPESCEPFLTVQMRNCLSSQHLRCTHDNTTWTITHIQPGPVVVSRVNNEFQWLDTLNLFNGEREELNVSIDPASLTELLETGEDLYHEVIDVEGPEGKRTKTIQGFDRLTGESITIDGEELLRTEFSYAVTYSDETPGYQVSGNQFVLPEDRLFLAGTDRTDGDEGQLNSDYSPVEFYRPGDDGFEDLTPRFGCNVAEIAHRP